MEPPSTGQATSRPLKVPLAVGIFALPLVFGGLILRPGYSKRARAFLLFSLLAHFFLLGCYYFGFKESGGSTIVGVTQVASAMITQIALGLALLTVCWKHLLFDERLFFKLGLLNPANALLLLASGWTLFFSPIPRPVEPGFVVFLLVTGALHSLIWGTYWVASMKLWTVGLSKTFKRKPPLWQPYLLTVLIFSVIEARLVLSFQKVFSDKIDAIATLPASEP